MTNQTKSAHLVTRVTKPVRVKFITKAQRYGQPSEVLRDIVEAFIEDRLTITPPVTRKENLYHE